MVGLSCLLAEDESCHLAGIEICHLAGVRVATWQGLRAAFFLGWWWYPLPCPGLLHFLWWSLLFLWPLCSLILGWGVGRLFSFGFYGWLWGRFWLLRFHVVQLEFYLVSLNPCSTGQLLVGGSTLAVVVWLLVWLLCLWWFALFLSAMCWLLVSFCLVLGHWCRQIILLFPPGFLHHFLLPWFCITEGCGPLVVHICL